MVRASASQREVRLVCVDLSAGGGRARARQNCDGRGDTSHYCQVRPPVVAEAQPEKRSRSHASGLCIGVVAQHKAQKVRDFNHVLSAEADGVGVGSLDQSEVGEDLRRAERLGA